MAEVARRGSTDRLYFADCRYSKAADWAYIAECAAIIKRAKEDMADATDASYQNLEHEESQRMAFIGYLVHRSI